MACDDGRAKMTGKNASANAEWGGCSSDVRFTAEGRRDSIYTAVHHKFSKLRLLKMKFVMRGILNCARALKCGRFSKGVSGWAGRRR
jgi:hypothetical protein